MRTIAIEEHFLANVFIKMQERAHPTPANGPHEEATARRHAKLQDLGALRLREMDASGIDLQVISHTTEGIVPLTGSEGVRLVQEANDQLAAAITAHPDRFAGLALLPMLNPKAAADELKRAVSSLGFKGALVNGTTQGRFLDDPVFLPILEQAVALDVPIYLHPAEPPAIVQEAYYAGFDPAVSLSLATSAWGWHSETAIHALRLILAGVFDRLPTLHIILGHMGEMLPFMLARIQEKLAPVARHLPHTITEYFLRNFSITTSGIFTDPPLLLALQVLGADRMLFAVDYPYSTNEQGRTFLDHVSLSPADKEKISHLNAERLLKLTK